MVELKFYSWMQTGQMTKVSVRCPDPGMFERMSISLC